MPPTKLTLLIVDDEVTIRSTLSQILSEFGHSVRVAADGLSALSEMGREVPDILLSDLNMPGMSGFELLTVVRRHFPTIRVIAMSGAFCGDEVPSGLAADAFYQKGSSVGALLRIMDTLPCRERKIASPSKMQTSLETEMSLYNGSPETSVMNLRRSAVSRLQ
jgi:CheY-like chemotaxis protein